MPATTEGSGPPLLVDSPTTCAAVEVHAAYRHRMIQASYLHRPRARYVIGAGPKADAPAPIAAGAAGAAADHVLVEGNERGFVVHVMAGMTGEVSRGGQAVSLDRWVEEHGRSFACHTGDQIQLRQGEVTFSITGAAPRSAAGQLAPGWFSGWRWREQKYTAGTAVALALLVQAAFMLPPDAKALTLARLGSDVRLLSFRIIPLVSPPTSAAGRALRAPDGQVGPANAPAPERPSRRRSPRDRSASPPPPVRPDAQRASERHTEIRSAGVLGIFAAAADDSLDLVLRPGAAPGTDPAEVLRGLVRGPGAGGPGAGELAMAGTGARPNARSDLGTIGDCGALGVGADCTGRPERRDPGRWAGRLRDRRAIAPQFVPGRPTVRGSLDREVVRRVVRLHLNEIRFCYQQELAARPDLAGRVLLNFTIAGDGRVAAALVESSTLGNPRAELCLVQTVRRWTFPQPAGGGLVIATYPFNFVAAGQGW